VRVATTKSKPTLTDAQVVTAPMCTGAWRHVVEPSPIWPAEFSPHAHRLPSVRIAIVVSNPAAIALYVATPMWTGARRCATVPSPSWPALLSPHAHRLPSVFRATVYWPPATTDFHVVPVPMRTGSARVVNVPSPSCPKLLSPHAHNVPSVRIASTWLTNPSGLVETLFHVFTAPTWCGEG